MARCESCGYEQRTRAYMRTMPLWRDHPALAEA
jgi:hypothetical protein